VFFGPRAGRTVSCQLLFACTLGNPPSAHDKWKGSLAGRCRRAFVY